MHFEAFWIILKQLLVVLRHFDEFWKCFQSFLNHFELCWNILRLLWGISKYFEIFLMITNLYCVFRRFQWLRLHFHIGSNNWVLKTESPRCYHESSGSPKKMVKSKIYKSKYLHDELMSSANLWSAVGLVKFFCYVFAKNVPSSPRAELKSDAIFLWIWP